MPTFNFYNHSVARFMRGENPETDAYKVVLLSSGAVFDATHTTLAEVTDSGASEVYGYGWAQGGEAIANPSISVYATNKGAFDGDDVVVPIVGGDLGPFSAYAIFNDTDADDAPIGFVTLDAPQTIVAGKTANIPWPAGGIVIGTPA